MPPDVRVRLSAEGVEEVVAALRKIATTSQQSGKQAAEGFAPLKTTLEGVRNLIATLGLTIGIAQLVEFSRRSTETAHEIENVTRALGGQVQGTAALSLAAKEVDLDLSSLRQTFGIFAQRSQQFVEGGGKAYAALRQLGISAKEFDGASLTQRLVIVAQKLAPLQDGAEKASLAMNIFGRRALALIPLLDEVGSRGFDEFMKRIDVLFTPDAIASAADFARALHQVGFEAQGLGIQFVAAFGPNVQQEMENLDSRIKTLADAAAGLGRIFGFAFKLIGALAVTASAPIAGLVAMISVGVAGAWDVARLAGERHFAAAAHRALLLRQQLADIAKDIPKTIADAYAVALTPPPGFIGPPAPESTQKPPKDNAPDKAQIQADLADEISQIKAARDYANQLDKDAYEEGRLSLAEYLAARSALLEASFAKEKAAIAAARKQISDLPAGEQKSAERQIDRADRAAADQAAKEREANAHLEYTERIKLTNELLAAERELLSAEDLRHQKELDAIAEKERANRVLFARAGVGEVPGAVAAAGIASAQLEQETFKHQQVLDEQKLKDLEAQRDTILAEINDHTISRSEGEAKLAALYKEQLPELRQMAELLVAMANATGSPTNLLAAEQFRHQVIQTSAAAKDLGREFRDSAQNSLASFIGSGIRGVKSLGDAFQQLFLSILAGIEQIAGREIASGLFSLFRNAGSALSFSDLLSVISFGHAEGGLIGHAAGGYVSGPGGPTSDSIPAMLSAGEYVIPARAVAIPGMLGLLESIRSGALTVATPRLASGGPVGFAGGGLVARSPAAANAGRASVHLEVALDDGLIGKINAHPSNQDAFMTWAIRNRRTLRDLLAR